MKFVGKRGVSEVITTVLILLLVVIVTTILWVVVNLNIEKGTDDTSTQCLTLNVEPIKCEAWGECSYTSGSGIYRVETILERKKGKGDLRQTRFIFDTAIDRNIIDKSVPSFDELERFSFQGGNRLIVTAEPNKVSVTPIVGKDNFVCNSLSRGFSCETKRSAPNQGYIPDPGGSNTADKCCQYTWNLTECMPNTGQPPGTGADCGIIGNSNDCDNINGCSWDGSSNSCTGTFIRNKFCCSKIPQSGGSLCLTGGPSQVWNCCPNGNLAGCY
jgi:hypothetical protein